MKRVSLAVAAALTAAAADSSAQPRPTGTLVVNNMTDSAATLIDAATGRIVATLRTGEGPHEVAISHDGRTALVSNYGVRGKPGSSLTVIDIVNARVLRTIPFGDLPRPHGSAFLAGDSTALVTSEVAQAIAVLDIRTGTIIRKIPTGGRTPHMLGATANGSRIVSGNMGDGTLAIMSVTGTDSARLVPVKRQPEGVALSHDGKFAWAGSNRDSVVLVIDTDRGVVVDTLRGFGFPYRTAISPDDRVAVTTDPVKGEVRVFDARTRAAKFTIVVPRDSVLDAAEIKGSPAPEGVTMSRDSRWAFVTLQGRNRVITIDLSSGQIVAWAPSGNWSDGIGYSPLKAAPK